MNSQEKRAGKIFNKFDDEDLIYPELTDPQLFFNQN